MKTAEIKLDLFRRIDNLTDNELKGIYKKFIELLNKPTKYTLAKDEKTAIEEALHDSNQKYSHDELIKEAKLKYPNLNFQ